MLCFTTPEKAYDVVPGFDEPSERLKVPSGVPPSGYPTVPLESVIHRLIGVSVGKPETLTTYPSPTETALGLTVHGGSLFRGEAARAT